MYHFNYLLILSLFTGLSNTRPARPPKEKLSWIVQKSSSLSINGRTNINHFSCGVAQYGETDTITLQYEGCRGRTSGIPLNGVLHINIGDFDCRNRTMTGEFKKTLLYKQYPQLKIIFLNLERVPLFGAQPETLKGQVFIEIAGVSKQFELDYKSNREDPETVQLTGSRQLCFSDFGLQPPQKMGGLVRVNETLDVRFMLSLRRIE
ncbi:MAG TPA: hypothetical protein VL727_29790 [Puia sp.]|jgi:hypothetical protein|nr:hypothetical protein [Puia sp.]